MKPATKLARKFQKVECDFCGVKQGCKCEGINGTHFCRIVAANKVVR